MASDQSPNPALNYATNYLVPLLVTLDEKVRVPSLKALIIMEVFIFCHIVVWFYNYKIQILEQIHEELKLRQTVILKSGSALNSAFPTTTFRDPGTRLSQI